MKYSQGANIFVCVINTIIMIIEFFQLSNDNFDLRKKNKILFGGMFRNNMLRVTAEYYCPGLNNEPNISVVGLWS